MARAAITKNALVANGILADPTPDSIDATNGMYIATGTEFDKIILRVKNTTASAKIATVKAGADPAFRRGLGDKAGSSLAQNAIEWMGPFECARFLQSNGQLWIDFGSSMTGEITCWIVPRVV